MGADGRVLHSDGRLRRCRAVTITATDVRSALTQTLKDHLPGALDALAAEKGLAPGALPAPRSWARLPDFTKLPEKQSPSVVVTSPGLEAEPARDYLLVYAAAWRIRAFVVIRGRSYDEVADRVGHYTAALRNAVLAHAQLGGLAERTIWVDETYAELAVDQARSIGAGSVGFVVAVGNAADGDLAP